MDASVLRILDVNVNRAREALRVIEDYARLVRDDAEAAGAAKRCRHALRAIVAALGSDQLLAARDIVGDVGRELKTDAELTRDTADDVVRAAFARLGEAARSIGEYAKIESAAAAAQAETLRYQTYELEQRIILRGALRQRFRAVRLYVLLTEALCSRPWLETLEAVVRGGAGCVQFREKALEDRELLRRARVVRDYTRQHGVLFAVNDRPDIAKLVDADILHLGQTDLSVADARRVAGASMLVGKSTHTPEQFEAALAENPDYVAVGPMYDTSTKPQKHIAGAKTLAAVVGKTTLPIVAIGGITAANVGPLIAAGASCIAVCGAVIGCPEPEDAARELLVAIESAANGLPASTTR